MFKSQPKKENFTQENAKQETIVGESVKLEGSFESHDNISIFGQVVGKIKTNKNLEIGAKSEIKGDLEGENIYIAGKVEGSVKAKSKLEVAASGKIFGDIQANILSIASGAIFCGQCQMEDKPQTSNLKSQK